MNIFSLFVTLFLVLALATVFAADHPHRNNKSSGSGSGSGSTAGGSSPSHGAGNNDTHHNNQTNHNNNNQTNNDNNNNKHNNESHVNNNNCTRSCVNSTLSSDGSFVEICVSLNNTSGLYRAEIQTRPSNSSATPFVVLHVLASGASLTTSDNCSLPDNSTVFTCYDSKNCSKPPRPTELEAKEAKPPQPRFSDFHFNLVPSSSSSNSSSVAWSLTAFLGDGAPSATFHSTLLPSPSPVSSSKKKSLFQRFFTLLE